MSLSLVFATMDWSAFWLMVLLLWGTMGMLAFLQANAQAGWVEQWCKRFASAWARGLVGACLSSLFWGLLAFVWVVLLGLLSLWLVWLNRENSIFDAPLFVAFFFAGLSIEEEEGVW